MKPDVITEQSYDAGQENKVITEEWYDRSRLSFPYIISHKDGYEFVVDDPSEDVEYQESDYIFDTADALCSPGNDVHVIYYDTSRKEQNSDRLVVKTLSCTVEDINDPLKERLLTEYEVPLATANHYPCYDLAISSIHGYFMALGHEVKIKSEFLHRQVIISPKASDKQVNIAFCGWTLKKGDYILRSAEINGRNESNKLLISISIME